MGHTVGTSEASTSTKSTSQATNARRAKEAGQQTPADAASRPEGQVSSGKKPMEKVGSHAVDVAA